MGVLDNLRARVQQVSDGLQTGQIVRDVLLSHGEDILDLQRRQLFEGRDSEGRDLRPYYSEDLKPKGYFRTVESARRYAEWKETGISYPYSAKRNPDAPNLYINGRFHDELGVQFDADSVSVIGTTGSAQRIMAKYGFGKFGLMKSNWIAIFAERGAYGELMQQIRMML